VIKDTIPGVVGNCASVTAFSVAWLTDNALPVVHVFSILAGTAASIATAAYYVVSWQARRNERNRTRARRGRYSRKRSKK